MAIDLILALQVAQVVLLVYWSLASRWKNVVTNEQPSVNGSSLINSELVSEHTQCSVCKRHVAQFVRNPHPICRNCANGNI